MRAARFFSMVVLLAVTAAFLPTASAGAARNNWRHRAALSYAALQHYLAVPGSGGLYLEKYPRQDGDNPYSYAWTLREAAAANVDVEAIPGMHGSTGPFEGLQKYWDQSRTPPGYDSYAPAPVGTGGDLFYDDNGVIGLELIRQFLATGERTMLDRAERVFPVVVSGWDTDPTHPCAGGLHWTQADWNTIKATNATGLAAELAAHLYELTHRRSYLQWAERLYGWNRTCTRASAGLYYNSIDFTGTVDQTLWIYNSGSMIGAAALLYRCTHDRHYLQLARADAAGAMSYWSTRMYDQPAIFDAIYLKNLLLLDSLDPNRRYRAAAVSYASRLWEQNRDPQTNLFRFQASGGGAYDPAARVDTLEQSAVVQVFSVLAWTPRDYRRIA